MSDSASTIQDASERDWDIPEPDISHLVIEDDEPVDNIYSEKQQALLTDCLFSSWEREGPFVALTDVGLFYALKEPAYVPDFLLSLDVEHPANIREKKHKTYLMWEFGKRPDLVIEVVSNIDRHEERKLRGYADIGIPYYVIHDPDHHLSQRTLRAYELHGTDYVEMMKPMFPQLGLGLTLWEGYYRGLEDVFARFVDLEGELLLTGCEKADSESQRADSESQRADSESQRADSETQRADSESQRADSETQRADRAEERARRLEARLRELEGLE